MTAPLDLPALRARHAADDVMLHARDGRKAFADDTAFRQMHADRAALLEALDAMTKERDAYRQSMREEMAENVTLFGLLRVEADIKAGTAGTAAVTQAIARLMVRADAAQAALDRLASVTVEEVAADLWGMDADAHAMADAVLAFVRARVAGPA